MQWISNLCQPVQPNLDPCGHGGLEQAAEGEPHRLGRHPQAAGQVDMNSISSQSDKTGEI